jgi:hypothetical protein
MKQSPGRSVRSAGASLYVNWTLDCRSAPLKSEPVTFRCDRRSARSILLQKKKTTPRWHVARAALGASSTHLDLVIPCQGAPQQSLTSFDKADASYNDVSFLTRMAGGWDMEHGTRDMAHSEPCERRVARQPAEMTRSKSGCIGLRMGMRRPLGAEVSLRWLVDLLREATKRSPN